MIEPPPALGEEEIERFGLRPGSRETVEDRSLLGGGIQPLADEGADDRVADELAALHHRLGLEPDRRSRGDSLAEHVSGR